MAGSTSKPTLWKVRVLMESDWTKEALNLFKESNGKFIGYTIPGSYPVVYFEEHVGTVCFECANSKGSQPRILGAFIHYEGAPETCEHCTIEIPSAYGDPEEVEEVKKYEADGPYYKCCGSYYESNAQCDSCGKVIEV